MRRLGLGLLMVMLLLPAARAEAAPIVFDFTLDFTSGPLAGQSFQGSFSVDGNGCPGGVCDGLFRASDPALTLLTFDVTVNGIAFDIQDEPAYPGWPQVTFDNGSLVQVEYYTEPDPFFWLTPPDLIVPWGPTWHEVLFFPSQNTHERSTGTFSLVVSQVPEPASMLLMGASAAHLWRRAGRRP